MEKLPCILQTFFITGLLLNSATTHACAWDSDTLADEKKKKPEIAEIIFGTGKVAMETPRLQKRITELRSHPREDEPAWWNDLAGAFIRLGRPQEAVNLLEPALKKFDSDYGVHANLGTAYHLLGRYQEAEKEIARDLEINPDAHFGLEKYHLALLQYLAKDEAYKKAHVYVDEFSDVMLNSEWGELGLMSDYSVEQEKLFDPASVTNDFPAYRLKWNLAGNTNFEAGVIYMATLNSREPASFVMLGIANLANPGRNRDLNLASAAFQKAIDLGSPQSDILKKRIKIINEHINHAQGIGFSMIVGLILCVVVLIVAFLILKLLITWISRTLTRKQS